MTTKGLLALLRGVRKSGRGWSALCAAHKDRKSSLSIHERDGKILLKCFAGCSCEAICTAIGIEMRDLFLNNGSRNKPLAIYPYVDETANLLFQVLRYPGKKFMQRRPNGGGGWIWKLGDVRRVLYQLPEVVKAKSVLIVEGEKDCKTACDLGLVATTNAGGANSKWLDSYSESLRDKRVSIIADADEPGRKHAQEAAASLFGKAESLKVLEFPDHKDLSEWTEMGGTREKLLELIDKAIEWKPNVSNATQQAASEEVEGHAVLDAVQQLIWRFVSLSESQVVVVALWVAHTHAIIASDATPYLAITSAEKHSGKTRLLEVLEPLVANPWLTGRATPAVLIRKIDKEHPTLLLDESDAAFASGKEYAEALRGILNSGHRRSGKASCCVGQGAQISYRDFSTFCPKAIAGIGKLPDTVADRSIPIRLKRTAPDEKVARFRHGDVQLRAEASGLKRKTEAWCRSIATKLRGARPELPEELTDRQQDGVEPLLAIADAAGGDWPQAARRALIELCSEARGSDDSTGGLLLADIRQVFESKLVERIGSVELATALAEIETSHWGEWSHGKPLTAARLARLLRPFEISPGCIRFGSETLRGYLLEQFQDAFRRYLKADSSSGFAGSDPQSATLQHAATEVGFSDSSKSNTATDVAAQECEHSNKYAACCNVAHSNPSPGAEKKGLEEEL
jgi:hypothetical protein